MVNQDRFGYSDALFGKRTDVYYRYPFDPYIDNNNYISYLIALLIFYISFQTNTYLPF